MLHISMHTHMSLTLCLRACSLLCIRTVIVSAQIWRHTCQALIWCFFIFGVFSGVRACWQMCRVIVQQSLLERFMVYCSVNILLHNKFEAKI